MGKDEAVIAAGLGGSAAFAVYLILGLPTILGAFVVANIAILGAGYSYVLWSDRRRKTDA